MPFLPENKAAVFFHTAMAAMKEYEENKFDNKESKKHLLSSLMDAHYQNSDKFSMEDVLAISMGAVYASPTIRTIIG